MGRSSTSFKFDMDLLYTNNGAISRREYHIDFPFSEFDRHLFNTDAKRHFVGICTFFINNNNESIQIYADGFFSEKSLIQWRIKDYKPTPERMELNELFLKFINKNKNMILNQVMTCGAEILKREISRKYSERDFYLRKANEIGLDGDKDVEFLAKITKYIG